MCESTSMRTCFLPHDGQKLKGPGTDVVVAIMQGSAPLWPEQTDIVRQE